jgi:hypothetical protein
MVADIETSTVWAIVATSAALIFVCYKWWDPLVVSTEKRNPIAFSACPNPNCARCQRYRRVQKTAKSRFPWVAKEVQLQYPQESLERVQSSIQNPTKANSKLQGPTVLMLSDLPSQEIVTGRHSKACRQFENNQILSTILQEIRSIPDSLWSMNDSPQGSWKVLPFLNQGTWVFDICKKCPETFQFIESLPNLLDDCLFGNVMISNISPGTAIEPHCGPTNIRHRLQYALQIPKQRQSMSLRVGTTRLEWANVGDFFVFDDSFVHSVTFPNQRGGHANEAAGDENAASRIVLIVDLWHPDLSPAERKLLQNLYPPS